VVGTGRISEEHLKFLQASVRAELTAVCDLSPALAELARSRFQASKAYTDVATMLAEQRPDVVHLLAPAHIHESLVRQCLEADAHVLVEKPVALRRENFLQLWDLAQARGRWLMEDHNYRFNQPIRDLQALLENGSLGRLREVEVRMALNIRAPGNRYADANLPHPSHRLPAAVLHEFITHLAYLGLLFLPDVDKLHAHWANIGGGKLFRFDDLDAMLTSSNGIRGRLRFSAHTAPIGFNVILRGERASAEADLFQPHVRFQGPRPGPSALAGVVDQAANGVGLAAAGVGNFFAKAMQKSAYEGLHRLLETAYEALATGGEQPVSFDAMDRTQALIDRLVSEQGK